MTSLCLTQRKTQLQFLEDACAARERARLVRFLPRGDQSEMQTRFLSLERRALLMEWPRRGVDAVGATGTTVDVYFALGHRRLAFRSETCGRVWHGEGRRGRTAALKLTLPIRILNRQQRMHYRVSVADVAPIPARFTSVTDPDRQFAVQLRDISAGGLRVTAPRSDETAVKAGEMYWVSFALSGEEPEFEFIVRITHASEGRRGDTITCGCAFCPSEDLTAQQGQLRRIEQFVAERERARLRRAGLRDVEGV